MEHISTFGLVTADRELLLEGEEPTGQATTTLRRDGARQSPVTYWDFNIDGVRLHERIAAVDRGYLDEVSPIQDAWPNGSVEAIRRLLGDSPGDLPDGRTSLLVCPECGDLGCGGVTANVVLDAALVHWRDLGWQRDYEDAIEPIPASGGRLSFTFARDEYDRLLRAELDRQQSLTVGWVHPRTVERRERKAERRLRWRRRFGAAR